MASLASVGSGSDALPVKHSANQLEQLAARRMRMRFVPKLALLVHQLMVCQPAA